VKRHLFNFAAAVSLVLLACGGAVCSNRSRRICMSIAGPATTPPCSGESEQVPQVGRYA